MKKAIEYLLIFIVVQVIVTYCVKGVWYLATGDSGRESGMLIVLTSILYGLAAIALFVWRKWTPVSGNYIQTRPWWVFFWSFLAALGMYLPAEWVLENMPELPNILKESFGDIINTPGGYLALGIVAPVAEEVVFRGAILRELLKWLGGPGSTGKAWGAIAISALLFALVHMNPAQMPYAFVAGLLMGWMYWRTGSILPGIVFHVTTNTISYVLMRLYSSVDDVKLGDIFSGGEGDVMKAVCFSLLVLLPSLFQLHVWMKRKG